MRFLLLLTIFFSALNAFAFTTGIRIISFSYHGNNYEYALWYPTDAEEQKRSVEIYEVSAALNAPLASDVKGVVVLSHGFGGNMFGQHDIAEYLAKNGYAVVTSTYPDMDGLKKSDRIFHPLYLRPMLSSMALENLKLKNFINKDAFSRVFVIGFSAGGYAAAVSAGGRVRLEALADYCGSSTYELLMCLPANYKKLKEFKDDDLYIPLPSVKAAVLIAPAYGVLFDKKSFVNVSIPFLTYIAEDDSIVTGTYDASYFASLLPHKTVNVVEKADHFVFIAPCSQELRSAYYSVCEDDPDVDRGKLHEKMNMEILSFFNKAGIK